MELYHYTIESNAIDIVMDKELKVDMPSVGYGGLLTTPGYVYFTFLSRAVYMGFSKGYMDYFYVFKVDLPEQLLYPDTDEYIIWDKEIPKELSYRKSLEEVGSVRVDQNVNADDFDVYYIKLPTNNNKNIEDRQDVGFLKSLVYSHVYSKDQKTKENFNNYFNSTRWEKL